MSILLDIAAYSALRTRGNIKVAYETQLMRELGTQGYAERKQAERLAKRKRGWKALFWLLVLGFPPFWPVAAIAVIWCMVSANAAS